MPPGVSLKGGQVFNGSVWDPTLFAKARHLELMEKRKRGFLIEWFYAARWGQPRRADLTEIYQLSQSAWARMCITTIIAEVAMVDWDIVPKDPSRLNDLGLQGVIDEIKQFLEKPNPNDESFDTLLRMLLLDILVYDSGVIVKVFDDGNYSRDSVLFKSAATDQPFVVPRPLTQPKGKRRLVELHVKNGASFLKDVGRDGIVRGYFQYTFAQPSVVPVWFSEDEIVYIMMSPVAGTPYGWSPLQSVGNILKSLIYSAQFNVTYFQQNEIPSGILSVLDISELEFERFKSMWKSEVTGKAHKLPLVDKEVKFQPFILTHREMQFVESTKWYQRLVMANYHVTMMELGLVEQGSQMSARESSLVFRRKAILPLLKLLARRLTAEIITEFSDEVEFKFNPVDWDERRFQLDIMEREWRMGVSTLNEIRTELGKPPLPYKEADLPPWLHRPQQPGFPGSPGYGAPGYFPPAVATPPLLPRIPGGGEEEGEKGLSSSAPVALTSSTRVADESAQALLELPPDAFYGIPNAPFAPEDPRVIPLTALEAEFQQELQDLFNRQSEELTDFLREDEMGG